MMPETEIKRLMKHLGEAINETLAESPRINDRIQDIRNAGYEVFLVIEAKVGFSRKGRKKNVGRRSAADRHGWVRRKTLNS